MEKKEEQLEEKSGWTGLTNVRSYCGACGHLIDFKDTLYWKIESGREIRRCKGCVE